uniref:G_PROTEIN_RECEP_F1_2 domain-containing protein n=1 Tax=Caenorhabditis tropicalis TaxID=1561998 RepID=A0A1I7U7P6_9PELO
MFAYEQQLHHIGMIIQAGYTKLATSAINQIWNEPIPTSVIDDSNLPFIMAIEGMKMVAAQRFLARHRLRKSIGMEREKKRIVEVLKNGGMKRFDGKEGKFLRIYEDSEYDDTFEWRRRLSFAIIAWIDHLISFALLILVMYLAIFCFKFYWNNKNRSVEWGRSYVLYAVISTWIIAFLIAGFTAFFQCDSHINTSNQCINIVCAVSNIFSAVFTELLTRVRIVIPIIIILLILLSVRVGSSTVRRESMVKVEGADIHGDRELMLMCSMVFGIYELSIMIPQLLIFFCISPLLSVAAWHFGCLFSTLATPIAVISISRNTRDRFWLLYTCHGGKGKNAPQGSYTHTAKKYHESVEAPKRRASGVSFFSQESSSAGSLDPHRKLSMIVEEPVGKSPTVEKVEEHHHVAPTATFSKAPKMPNVVRVQSAEVARSTIDYDLSRRRMSHNDMPQVGDTDRLAQMINSKTKRFSLGGRGINMNVPNHIFVHHIHHENKIRPMNVNMVE